MTSWPITSSVPALNARQRYEHLTQLQMLQAWDVRHPLLRDQGRLLRLNLETQLVAAT